MDIVGTLVAHTIEVAQMADCAIATRPRTGAAAFGRVLVVAAIVGERMG